MKKVMLAIALWAQVLLRLLMGFMWTSTGRVWLRADDPGGRVLEVIELSIERGTTSGVYRSFLESVVAPNTDLFATFATIGELAVGASLFLGLGTRLGVAGALFLALNYSLTIRFGLFPPSGNMGVFLVNALLLIGTPGRRLGLDRLLVKRWPEYRL